MNSIVPEPPPVERRRERRRFVPRLSDDPDVRSIQVGIVATLIIHMLVIFAVPKSLLSSDGRFTVKPHPQEPQFNIELTPEQVAQPVQPPKPPAPKHYVETNPNAPSNIPDKTDNFAAQNQQAAQKVASKNPTGDRPDRESDKKVESNQVVSGDLSKPQPTVIAPPPTPVQEKQTQVVQKKTAAREQNPLPGIEKDIGDSKDSFGTEVAKIARNSHDVPNKVEGTPDAPLIEGAIGLVNIDPHHPMPRPHLDTIHARPAVFQENKFGTSNIGPEAIDARWSSYGQYLRQMMETVQIQWDKLLTDAKTYPSPGTVVHVRFVLASDGSIAKVLEVRSESAGRQAQDFCVAAITLPAPYDKWSKDMISVLGDQQEMTFVFYYQ